MLQKFPHDLLVKIFVYLAGDVASLRSVALVNSHLYQAFLESLPLLYRNALRRTGMVDRLDVPCAAMFAPADSTRRLADGEKLNALGAREEAWLHLDFVDEKKKFKLDGSKFSSTMVSDLADGVLALGENTVDYCETAMYYDLHERKVVTGRIHEAHEDIMLLDVALALRDYDLIALISESSEGDDINSRIPVVHLLQFSTGKPHPLVKSPHLSLREACKGVKGFSLAKLIICGQHLLINASSHRHEGGPSRLILFDWQEGVLVATYDLASDHHCDFVLIRPDIVLCSSSSDRCLRLIYVPVDHRGDEPPRFETRLILHLPKLRSGFEYYSLRKCASKPDLFGEQKPPQRDIPLRRRQYSSPFACSPDNSLIKIILAVKVEGDDEYVGQLAMVMHRRSLAELVERYASLHEAIAGPYELEWHEWGPPITHVYRMDDNAWGKHGTARWEALTHNVAGQRLVLGDTKRVILRDFNPHNVHMIRERIGPLKGSPSLPLSASSIKSEPTTSVATVTVVDQPQTSSDIPIFEEPVTSCLPYVETIKHDDFSHLKGFMMTEDCIVGVRHANDNITDALHAIDVYPNC